MPKAIAPLFTELGAPLKNVRNSWGAVRSDGAVFLRVWQDETINQNGVRCSRITNHARFKEDPKAIGYRERLEHIQLVQNGSKCYLVVCIVKDVTEQPRKIHDFVGDSVFEAGKIIEVDGDSWIECGSRLSVRDIAI